jgi:hypothetical protein
MARTLCLGLCALNRAARLRFPKRHAIAAHRSVDHCPGLPFMSRGRRSRRGANDRRRRMINGCRRMIGRCWRSMNNRCRRTVNGRRRMIGRRWRRMDDRWRRRMVGRRGQRRRAIRDGRCRRGLDGPHRRQRMIGTRLQCRGRWRTDRRRRRDDRTGHGRRWRLEGPNWRRRQSCGGGQFRPRLLKRARERSR